MAPTRARSTAARVARRTAEDRDPVRHPGPDVARARVDDTLEGAAAGEAPPSAAASA